MFGGESGHSKIPGIIRAVGGPLVARFHGFTLDAGRRVVSHGDSRVHLTRKAFDMLNILVERAPLVVSKDELHRLLWPETFVTDATVAGVVKELRRMIREGVDGEPLIRTTHGVGYSFTGTIERGDRDDASRSHCWLVAGLRRLPLAEGVNEIGRDPGAAVLLDSPQASRRHARILIADQTAVFEDLGSKNRTRINDLPVTEPTRLRDGDTIHIGSAVFVFRVMDAAATTVTAGTNEPA